MMEFARGKKSDKGFLFSQDLLIYYEIITYVVKSLAGIENEDFGVKTKQNTLIQQI